MTSYPERKPQRYLYPSQPPVVDNQRIHGTELAVLDGRALRKRHVLARPLIMREGCQWSVEHWSVNTSESISLLRIASDSACFLVVSAKCNLVRCTCHISKSPIHNRCAYN